MTEYPLLPVPKPGSDKRPKGGSGGSKVQTPSRAEQRDRLGPIFQRLRDVFDRNGDPLSLREEPLGIAPERALVFEVAGSIGDFSAAVARIGGLDFLADEQMIFEPDDKFGVIETRKGREPGIRDDKPIAGRLYMAMPDTQALRNLLSLWRLYEVGEAAPRGFAPWFEVFKHLHTLRAWGPADRIPSETIQYLEEELAVKGANAVVRVEVEMWYVGTAARRSAAKASFEDAVAAAEGVVVDQAEIGEIGYMARLVDLPAVEVQRLIAREEVSLAICDDVMMVRPQSTVEFPVGADPLDEELHAPPDPEVRLPPVAALFDAMPVQNHTLLAGRLVLDDPDDFEAMSVVAERKHGTEMASLILHGDRNLEEEPLSRPIYLRPVLYAPGGGRSEQPLRDRLLLDLIYQAVLRMKVGDAEGEATAPGVFIVNLSLGDRNRPFAGPMSPWGRLLDYLADRFGILFLVSAGNVTEPLAVRDFAGLTDFENASAEDREAAILRALAEQQAVRTLLSPAESLNAVTVGAWHEDGAPPMNGAAVFSPFAEATGPNISSAIGLGHRKVVKPDIFMPGGRELVRVSANGAGGVSLRLVPPGRLYGLRCAVPDGGGDVTREGFSSGTSAATALATRAAHRIFDALSDPDNGNLLEGVDPDFYGVIVKAMLVHRAQWGSLGGLLDQTWLPQGPGSHVVRRDGIARLLGYGRPAVHEAMECAANRATMIGFGEIPAGEQAALYRIPLPQSLERVREPRALTVSLAWFSPVNIRHQAYRRAKLEVAPDSPDTRFGVARVAGQPSDKAAPRGSLLHVRYAGERAVAFVDGNTLGLRVFCREQGGALDQSIRYGLAVTIEAGAAISVYEEVRQGLGIRPRP
ncbi:S8 family peptidase [Oceaniglobus trochenteri]|uniref:S8 family peptidase n=1 Tax=Oceaniglobus trochenteri TaxID=2763260 RepID=UPI001D001087|nr:S8 family peptidase [Oceaniglobus trochenteri]